MTVSSSLTELQQLATGGALRFVYILGVPRANTTVLCRLIGQRLHGAVYEPALPNTAFPAAAYSRKILAAYRAVRASVPRSEPVTLAIKDLSALMTDRQRDFALDLAAHVVFAIREPTLQHASYVRQLLAEFDASNRWKALARTPWETTMYGLHFGRRWPRYRRLSKQRFGIGWSEYRRMTAAGSNLDFWRSLAAHFVEAVRRLPEQRITVIDAGLSRLMPEAAEAQLDEITAAIAPHRRPGQDSLDIAGHSLMRSDSAWAAEAMSAKKLKGFTAPDEVRSPVEDFDEWLPRMAGALYPHYLQMFYHPTHRLRRRFGELGADLPEEARAPMGHLLEAADAVGAEALARQRGRIAA